MSASEESKLLSPHTTSKFKEKLGRLSIFNNVKETREHNSGAAKGSDFPPLVIVENVASDNNRSEPSPMTKHAQFVINEANKSRQAANKIVEEYV